jgi:hypothetical protein
MRINVAIAVAEQARDRIYEVAQVCRAFGFAHTSTLPHIGVLIGSAEAGDLPMLRAIPGVLAVETERALRRLQRSWSSNGKVSALPAAWPAGSMRSR